MEHVDDEPVIVKPCARVGGDNDTVFMSGYVARLSARAISASLSRYVFDVGAWDNSRWIVFHGASGNPGSPFYDNVMLWAVNNGFVGVNATYRLAPQSPYPAGAEDLADIVAWVASQIGERGGDPARIYLMGHSAGAIHVANYVSHP